MGQQVLSLRRLLSSTGLLLVLAVFPTRATFAGPHLDVVYPKDGHITTASTIFVFGTAPLNTDILVNGQRATTYENRSFLAVIPLRPGPNLILTVAKGLQRTAVDRRMVRRIPPLASVPDTPTLIRPESLYPSSDAALLPGDVLRVSFQGSPGGKATFAVGRGETIPMQEVDPASTGGMRGIYTGEYSPGPGVQTSEVITFTLLGKDGAGVKATAPGKLTVWEPDPPFAAKTLDGAVLRESPDGRRLGELPAGVKLHVVGRLGEETKTRLSPTLVAWVLNRSIRALPKGTPADGDVLEVNVRDSKESTQVRVSLTANLPFIVIQQTRPEVLVLTIYAVRSAPATISRNPEVTLISSVEAGQDGPGTFQLKIRLNLTQQWGYQISYEENALILAIRRSPKVDERSPVAGRIIALDAGHGGEETGSVGPTRLAEKDVNLAIALRLRDLLVRRRATVVMTRTEDRYVALDERVTIARQAGAELLVSIHSNMPADGEDPRLRHGTGTYYYHPQSRALAESVQRALLERFGLRDDGVREGSFVLTRPTQMPAILVEIAYMTYPPEEALLRHPAFQTRAAMALMNSIEAFLRDGQ